MNKLAHFLTEDNSSFFRDKGAAKLVANILKENLDNESMCLDASIIFSDMTQLVQYLEEMITVYTSIGFELIFQVLSKYTESVKICENLLKMFDKRLYVKLTVIEDFKKNKDKDIMLKEVETLRNVMEKHKTSRIIARGFLSFFKTFSFCTELRKDFFCLFF